MNTKVVEVQLRGVIPTENGSAIFLTDGEKTMLITVDISVGLAITMLSQEVPRERPITYDLIQSILIAFGGTVNRVVINDVKDSTYYARLILSAKNELIDAEKIMEIDARPSDCIAIATLCDAPIYVARKVWEEAEDVTEVLEQIESSDEHHNEDEEGDDEDEEES